MSSLTEKELLSVLNCSRGLDFYAGPSRQIVGDTIVIFKNVNGKPRVVQAFTADKPKKAT